MLCIIFANLFGSGTTQVYKKSTPTNSLSTAGFLTHFGKFKKPSLAKLTDFKIEGF